MNRNSRQLEKYFYRFGEWLKNKPVGLFISRFPSWAVFIALVLIQAFYWATAWWSPIPFIVFVFLGFALMTYLGRSPLTIYSLSIRQAATTEIGAKMLTISLPFMLAQVAAFFACLYMLGDVKTSNGVPIDGSWEHFYFSVVTLTTLGYGNIVPSDRWTEFVAVLESLLGFMAFAVYAGVLASIALRRSVGPDDFESRIADQGGFILTNEEVTELNINQEIGTRYFLRYIYVTIYPSQYQLLKFLVPERTIGIDSIKDNYYSKLVSENPNATRLPTYDEWFRYLIDNKLIVESVNGSLYTITENGVRFIHEVTTLGAEHKFAT